MLYRFILGSLVSTMICSGQLTPDQKQFDMQSLASIYAKRYGPAEWKRNVFQFDVLSLSPWVGKVAATANDLDFYDVLIDYVASLNDTHDHYLLPSTFSASLNISLDVYDGKVLIDGINRTRLPAGQFPFQIGDEVVSVDGKPVADLIAGFSKYVIQANPRSTKRMAAAMIAVRRQSQYPYAPQVGDNAAVVVQNTAGLVSTYSLPWTKAGIPLSQIGPVASPQSNAKASARAAEAVDPAADLETSGDFNSTGVLGYGSLTPVFSLPTDFKQRLGGSIFDEFYSGTFQSQGLTLGYIRIPSYLPSSTTLALTQFEQEIAFMQSNTDGLIVDEMRNPGGNLCYGEEIVARLIPTQFRSLGYEIRATWDYVNFFYSRLLSAQLSNSPPDVIGRYQMLSDAMSSAYTTGRARTDSVPLCTSSFDRPPAADKNGAVIAYSKPLIMLIDEFSASTADSVPAMLQDNKRGQLVGWRTNGAGGSNSSWQVGSFSEGTTGVTLALMTRKDPVVTDEYAASQYVENVGVRPDVAIDYMTRDNLLQGGRGFFSAATDALVKQVQGSR